MQIDIGVEGLQETVDRLKKLAADDAARAMRKGINAAADEVLRESVAQAPVDDGVLRDAITKKVRVYRGTTVVAIVGADVAKAPHAHLVELGTAPRLTKSGKAVGVMPANPFMRRALAASRARAQAALERTLAAELAGEAGGGA